MPRIIQNRKIYMKRDLTNYIVCAMRGNKTQQYMASKLGISQPSFSRKLKNAAFDFEELVTIFSELGASGEEIIKLMKV